MRTEHRQESNGQNLRSEQAEQGFALPMVLLALLVLSVIAVMSIQTAGHERQAGTGALKSTKAFYAAEAGLHGVVASWDSARYDTMTALAGAGDSLNLGNQLIPENGQVYRAVIRRVGDSATKLFQVTSEAVISAQGDWYEGGRRVAVTVEGPQEPRWALFGLTQLYHSMSPVNGDIGSNGNIMVSGPVVGNAHAGGTVSDTSQVSGTVTESAAPVDFPPIACPATDFGPAPIGEGVTFNPVTGDLTMSGPNPTTFLSGTYYFRDFFKGGTGALIIPDGEMVEIYARGDLMIWKGPINPEGPSEKLKMYGCDSSPDTWNLSSPNAAWLRMLAPPNALTVQGSGDKYGSFVAATVESHGPGTVFYEGDSPGGTGGYRPIAGTWADLSD